jgi:hypothetical protein
VRLVTSARNLSFSGESSGMNHANEDSQHTTHGDAALAVQMPEGGHHDGRHTEITEKHHETR